MLKKFKMENSKPIGTPMSTNNDIHSDPNGKEVDATHYRGMIGSSMYQTASRPDIMYSTCVCAKYQPKPKE